MKTDPDESAFCNGYEDPGLTKREYFAGLAMQGLLALPVPDRNNRMPSDEIAELCCGMADVLIAELNKDPK
jgi:hypothetical protein